MQHTKHFFLGQHNSVKGKKTILEYTKAEDNIHYASEINVKKNI